MPASITATLVFSTAAPPSAVWAALEAAPRWPQVLDDCAEARIEPHGKLTAGSVIHSRAKAGSESADTASRVVAARRPRELTTETEAGHYRWRDSYVIASDGQGGARITVTSAIEAVRPLDKVILFFARKRYLNAFTVGIQKHVRGLVALAERIAGEGKA